MEKKLPVLADVKIQIKKMMQSSRNSFLFEISSDYILRNLTCEKIWNDYFRYKMFW